MNRRRFVRNGITGAAGVTLASVSARAKSPEREVNPPATFELDEATIADLQTGMKSGKYSAQSLTRKYLERIDDIDKRGPAVNSVIELNPDALAIAAKHLRPTPAEARTPHLCDVFYGEEKLDQALVTLFPAPHSFTGDDTVEIVRERPDQRADDQHQRRVETHVLIHDLHDRELGLLRSENEFANPTERCVLPSAAHFDFEHASEVLCSSKDFVASFLVHWQRFTRNGGLVE